MFVSDDFILEFYIAPRDTYTFDVVNYFIDKQLKKFKQCFILEQDEYKLANNLMLKSNDYFMNTRLHKRLLIDPVNIYDIKHFEYPIQSFQCYDKEFINSEIDWWCGKKISYNNFAMCPKFDFLEKSDDFNPNHYLYKLYHNHELKFEKAFIDYLLDSSIKKDNFLADLIKEFKKQKLDIKDIFEKIAIIIQYKKQQKDKKNKNSVTSEYLRNVNNRLLDPKIREMAHFKSSIYFVRKMMELYPNLNLFLLNPVNGFYKIENIVSKNAQNALMIKEYIKSNTEKYLKSKGEVLNSVLLSNKADYVYSVDNESLIYVRLKKSKWKFLRINEIVAYSRAKKIKLFNTFNESGEYEVELKNRSRFEKMYSFVLSGKETKYGYPVIDVNGNIFYFENILKYLTESRYDIVC